MAGKSKQWTAETEAAAWRIVEESGADITKQVKIVPLAKLLMAERECSIDSAKQHVAKAVRVARGEYVKAQHGGKREGAGRPKNEEPS